MAKERLSKESENDFIASDEIANEGFWITVKNASIQIRASEEGISIAVYQLGSEMDDSLSEAWVTYAELGRF